MLTDKLKEYSKSGIYPFHMPGHKRNRVGDLPYELDVTEIDGFDNLHDPCGIIREIERNAEKLFRAKRAFMLVNGATGGILASIRAVTKAGDKVIIARNCHKSVYNAVELCGLKPAYYLPEAIGGTDIYGSVSPEKLDKLLADTPDAQLVVITSPTYEGVCSDIEAIARICHDHGARLIVDEAHGAHFPFCEGFPKHAIECGADISVVSLHKTLPAPTQTALLLTNDGELTYELQQQLAVFETSSPSYLLMAGVEQCLEFCKNTSFKEYYNRLNKFYQDAERLKKLALLYRADGGKLSNVFSYDPGKLVITTYGTDLTGRGLADILRKRYQIETEMSSAHYVIAMTSVCDTDEGFERLLSALYEIDDQINYSDKELCSAILTELPKKSFDPSERKSHKAKVVAMQEAAGKTSLGYIYAYPPGIPYLVPGEVIGADMIKRMEALQKCGVEICGEWLTKAEGYDKI